LNILGNANGARDKIPATLQAGMVTLAGRMVKPSPHCQGNPSPVGECFPDFPDSGILSAVYAIDIRSLRELKWTNKENYFFYKSGFSPLLTICLIQKNVSTPVFLLP
jgi:hypothetical protein